MKHLFIINPVAGGRRGNVDEIKATIAEFAKGLAEPHEVYATKAPMDACGKIILEADELKKSSPQEMLYVYACGGDGTLNECVNGAVGRVNVAVTHYPCGTGNDFLKTFVPENAEKFRNLNAISKGTVKQLDIIDCGDRYGINICSVGIDARVGTDVHKYSSIPLIGGATGYIVSLIVNVIKGVTQRFRITCRGIVAERAEESNAPAERVFDKKLTLACACNGRYYGGGFNPVPDALPDDGILECLVVEPVSRLKVAEIVGRYSKGRFSEFPDIFNYIRCTEMTIEADKKFVINIDGEGVYADKITFKLIPKAVNFIFPDI